jgi:plasmid stabilization system protein ParE
MSLPVVLRPEASRDAEEARDYLEAQRAGLGQVFLDRLDEVLGRIGAFPQIYGVV